ncbi:MAG: hypothetical protein E7525_04725 [Ruminococcaceae bacterium]|nr:hypothetical protein [Oscillospiraceae bacterium]
MNKRIIKLINNERTTSKIKSLKADAGECGADVTAADICHYFDRAKCSSFAYDECTKDYTSCSNHSYDFCNSDYDDPCKGIGVVDIN